MTVVVGIYCSDGVVIAADSALTIGSVIEQSYAKKVACISDDLIVAFAGDLGFAQRFRQVAKDIWGQDKQNLRAEDFHKLIEAFSIGGISEHIKYIRPTDPINISTECIIGFSHCNRHHLSVFQNGSFQPIVINENRPFHSLGSGHYLTNPFLHFIKEVFWEGKSCPKLPTGIFSALMAMNLAVELNAGGINAPIHIAVLENTENGYKCRILHTDEMSMHEENYKAALKYFSKYSHFYDRENIQNAPSIPQLTS
jgi:20S proteasome alpha/beta subunit